jgi:hypothetical protein
MAIVALKAGDANVDSSAQAFLPWPTSATVEKFLEIDL